MQFKGIKRDKSNSGEVVEFSAEEKLIAALQIAVSGHSELKDSFVAWPSNVSASSLSVFSKGKLLKDKWQNNLYKAEGTFDLNRRRMDPDRMLAPRNHLFQLEFEDSLDSVGLPDIKVVKFTIQPTR